MIRIVKSEDQKAISWIIHKFCEDIGLSESIEKAMFCNIPVNVNLLAYDDDKLVGGGGYIRQEDGYIGEYFWVDESYRSRNVGGLLWRFCMKDTKGNLRIVVNPERFELYDKLGFVPAYYIIERRNKNER